jgi:hypothetical protein
VNIVDFPAMLCELHHRSEFFCWGCHGVRSSSNIANGWHTDHSNDEAPALAGDLNGHLFAGEKLG